MAVVAGVDLQVNTSTIIQAAIQTRTRIHDKQRTLDKSLNTYHVLCTKRLCKATEGATCNGVDRY